MKHGEASRTAVSAASMRAAHYLLFDEPAIFADSFALALMGLETPGQLRAALAPRPLPELRRIAAFFALRHRYSEDRLMASLARGADQVVLLGAGLDSFALRHPEAVSGIRYFEIDHPDSQRSKRARLAELDLDTPGVRYVEVDFARVALADALAGAGVARDRITFFAWLGVTQYIPGPAVDQTFALVAQFPAGSEIVFDAILPFDDLDPADQAISRRAADVSATFGEPWMTFIRPQDLATDLRARGWSAVETLGPAQAAARYYRDQPVEPLAAWQMMSATV